MEQSQRKKDQTLYIVFACKQCKRYLYVKTTQKTKKCLACGRTHQVKEITWGIIVKGMTTAVNTVKEKQHALALKELGHAPDFEGNNIFIVYQEPSEFQSANAEILEYDQFRDFIAKLSEEYKEFPRYVIEMLTEEKGLESRELNLYLVMAVKEGFLEVKNGLYSLAKRR